MTSIFEGQSPQNKAFSNQNNGHLSSRYTNIWFGKNGKLHERLHSYTWICLRCFFALYHGKSPFVTTIWDNMLLLCLTDKKHFTTFPQTPVNKIFQYKCSGFFETGQIGNYILYTQVLLSGVTSEMDPCWGRSKRHRIIWGIKRVTLVYFSHTIHVWYIYLHLVDFYGKLAGKYTSPMDAMGFNCDTLQIQTPKPEGHRYGLMVEGHPIRKR